MSSHNDIAELCVLETILKQIQSTLDREMTKEDFCQELEVLSQAYQRIKSVSKFSEGV